MLSNIGEHSSKLPSSGRSQNPKLNWSISEGGKGRNDPASIINPDGETSKQDPVKSRKFVKHWKEAASMSKLGNRTKSLLGKFGRTPHSQSVDMVASQDKLHNPSYSGTNR